jgi:hypothetical protein
LAFVPFSRRRSGVAGCFLDELHARGQAKFGVDVGEVGLHREQPKNNRRVTFSVAEAWVGLSELTALNQPRGDGGAYGR